MPKPLLLESQRLILRQIMPTRVDAKEYMKKGTGYSRHNSIPKVIGHIQRLAKDGWECFVILKETNEIVGSIELCHLNWWKQAGEIGYHIREQHRRKGYAVEAAVTVINYCFNKLNFHKMYADTDPDNLASQRVLKKLGFMLEGISREKNLVKGRWTDELDYGLLKSEWKHKKNEPLK